jgi:hypothetical protein
MSTHTSCPVTGRKDMSAFGPVEVRQVTECVTQICSLPGTQPDVPSPSTDRRAKHKLTTKATKLRRSTSSPCFRPTDFLQDCATAPTVGHLHYSSHVPCLVSDRPLKARGYQYVYTDRRHKCGLTSRDQNVETKENFRNRESRTKLD